MIEHGFMSAYEPGEIRDTNSFRGACDVIYYNPSVVTQVGKAEILNDPTVMDEDSLKPRLSDHFPFRARFMINP